MTIDKGRPWGEVTSASAEREAEADAELAELAAAAVDQGHSPTLAVRSGDVRRTLGLSAVGDAGGAGAADSAAGAAADERETMRFPFDLGRVELDDGRMVPFVAHLIARRLWWGGHFAVVMNVAWRGSWYLGPRAHPNDGLLDIFHGSLPLLQRVEARRRVTSGTHLPHPALPVLRAATWEHRFDRRVGVYADGARVGTTRWLRVDLQPDCFELIA